MIKKHFKKVFIVCFEKFKNYERCELVVKYLTELMVKYIAIANIGIMNKFITFAQYNSLI